MCFILFFKIYFIDYAIIVVSIFPPLPSSTQYLHSLQQSLLSSCPWVMHISSLATPLPILFLTSPCLLCTYWILLLNPCTLSLLLFLPPPSFNPPNDLHIYDSVPVLLVCLVCFCFCFLLGSVFNSCEFVVILLFITLIIFFFLDKSLYHFM